MKAKITRGTGFRGVLDYALDTGNQKGKNPEIVGGTLTPGTAREMSAQFAVSHQLRPDIKSPVWHASLALPEGERLSSEKWSTVAEAFMNEMGFPTDSLYTVIRHSDTAHDHVHIIASRVSLSGALWHGQWEVYRAIRATQTLERVYGLTLTPGLGEPMDEKSLTKNEIEQALRTGEEPPRQRLQHLIMEAAKGKPTAVMFVERLELAGVGVRFQIQKTGITGVSYELDGIAFKGQSLGAAFKWSRFSKKFGVSYEQARDGESLERFTTAVADRAGRDEPGNAGRSLEVDAGIVATSSSGADSRSAGTVGQAEGRGHSSSDRIRQSDGRTTTDAGGTDAADEHQRGAGVRAEGREARRDHLRPVAEPVRAEIEHQQHGSDRAADQDSTGGDGQRAETDDRRSAATGRSGERDAPTPMAADAGPDSSRGRGSGASVDWSSGFRKASAAKRRATESKTVRSDRGQGDTERNHIAKSDRQSAREIDPTAYLESQGFEVKRDGQRHLSVRLGGDEHYRGTRQKDGHFVWCDLHRNGIGDNIALVRDIEPGTGFADAVYRLSGAPTVSPRAPTPPPAPRTPPRLPSFTELDRVAGREYLMMRGISEDTIDHAEKTGMVRYSKGAVLFVGYDSASVAQNITRRSILPNVEKPKLDLKGSYKSFSQILPGDKKSVWIVEGGTDALALHDIAKRQGKPAPTVIVSGGAGVLSFLQRPEIQTILKQADRVVIAGENEKSEAVQRQTDADHQKQADRVAEITGRTVKTWKPKPDQGKKDLADVNFLQQRKTIPVPPMEPDHRMKVTPSQVADRNLTLD